MPQLNCKTLMHEHINWMASVEVLSAIFSSVSQFESFHSLHWTDNVLCLSIIKTGMKPKDIKK